MAGYSAAQLSNSPDLNINDLGFFAALQAMYHHTVPKDLLHLIEKVKQAHRDYPAEKINRLFLTLQACMNEIIDSEGGNQYKIPHIGKVKLERLGQLPWVLKASPKAAGLTEAMAEAEKESLEELGSIHAAWATNALHASSRGWPRTNPYPNWTSSWTGIAVLEMAVSWSFAMPSAKTARPSITCKLTRDMPKSGIPHVHQTCDILCYL